MGLDLETRQTRQEDPNMQMKQNGQAGQVEQFRGTGQTRQIGQTGQTEQTDLSEQPGQTRQTGLTEQADQAGQTDPTVEICLRTIRQISRLTAADLSRFVRSPKAALVLVFSIFFAWDFVELVVPYAEGLNVSVTPFVYPLFLNEWSGSLYTLLLICVLMSDAPFQNGSELFLRLRVSKYVWLAGKTLYILAVSFLYQVILAILCALVFVPETGVGFSTSWGYVLRSYYIGTGGAVDVNGNAVAGSLLSYAPVTAMLLQILLASLVSAMLGMLMFLLNTLFRNYTGTVLVSVTSCAHLLLGSFGIYNAVSFDSMMVPTSWINLGDLLEEMSPYLAAGILAGIVAVLALTGAVLLKFRRIEVWE